MGKIKPTLLNIARRPGKVLFPSISTQKRIYSVSDVKRPRQTPSEFLSRMVEKYSNLFQTRFRRGWKRVSVGDMWRCICEDVGCLTVDGAPS